MPSRALETQALAIQAWLHHIQLNRQRKPVCRPTQCAHRYFCGAIRGSLNSDWPLCANVAMLRNVLSSTVKLQPSYRRVQRLSVMSVVQPPIHDAAQCIMATQSSLGAAAQCSAYVLQSSCRCVTAQCITMIKPATPPNESTAKCRSTHGPE